MFSWPAVGAEEERMLHRCVGGMQEGKLLTQDSAVQGLVAGGLGVEDVVVQLAPDGPPQAVHSRLDGVAGLDGLLQLAAALVVHHDAQRARVEDLPQAHPLARHLAVHAVQALDAPLRPVHGKPPQQTDEKPQNSCRQAA